MKIVARLALVLCFCFPLRMRAGDAESQIQKVLDVQVEAWNHGDIPGFVETYAADCVFVGKQVAHGRDQLRARYEKTYPTREAMGHLGFSALEVHVLTRDVAIVTGEWHIDREGPADKNIGGLFSLVFHRTGDEWKIALDHTS